MKKILVPTDFSACADNAITFAINSAKMFPAEIILMHTFEFTGDIYTDYMGVNKAYNQSLWNEAKLKLQALKEKIENTEKVVVTTMMFSVSVKEAIIEAALSADIVVMGTIGAKGFTEKLWGSNTASILGTVGIPVLVIPHQYKWKKPDKMLLTTNQFETDQNTLNNIFELADLYHASVKVGVFTDEEDVETINDIEHTLKIPGYEQVLNEKYLKEPITISQLSGLNFETTLQDYIHEHHIDVLIMITYRKNEGIWDRMFNPSVTRQLSYHTKIPLLVLPAAH